MTPLRFRAWDTENKMMLAPADDIAMTSTGIVLFDNGEAAPNERYDRVSQWVPLMSTGLTDKNGKEIFEGDVCRLVYRNCEGGGWYSKSNEQGVVYFSSKWGWKFDCADATQRVSEHWKTKYDWEDMQDVEVIGNVHENPDLLK